MTAVILCSKIVIVKTYIFGIVKFLSAKTLVEEHIWQMWVLNPTYTKENNDMVTVSIPDDIRQDRTRETKDSREKECRVKKELESLLKTNGRVNDAIEVQTGFYTQTYRLSTRTPHTASVEEEFNIYEQCIHFLNSFAPDVKCKITIKSQKNQDKPDIYLTLGVHAESAERTEKMLQDISSEISADGLREITPVNADETVRLLLPSYDKGEDIKFWDKYFTIGPSYGTVFCMKRFPVALTSDLIADLSHVSADSIISVYYEPVSNDKIMCLIDKEISAVKEAKGRYGVDFPPSFQARLEAAENLKNDITERSQNVFLTTVTMAVTVDSAVELHKSIVETKSIAKNKNVSLDVLNGQQASGLITVLPIAKNELHYDRMLTSESAAAFISCTKTASVLKTA